MFRLGVDVSITKLNWLWYGDTRVVFRLGVDVSITKLKLVVVQGHSCRVQTMSGCLYN